VALLELAQGYEGREIKGVQLQGPEIVFHGISKENGVRGRGIARLQGKPLGLIDSSQAGEKGGGAHPLGEQAPHFPPQLIGDLPDVL